jgi:hypothetical protein
VRTLLPWLPAFLFGGVLIFVGKYLQSVEKKKRLERKLTHPFGISIQFPGFDIQTPPPPFNKLGSAHPGKPQKPQEKGFN